MYSPSSRKDPLENYLTEAFAAILELNQKVGHHVINYIAAKCGRPQIPDETVISYFTQFPLSPGYADLIAKVGNDTFFVFEHKAKSKVIPGQTRAYQESACAKWGLPVYAVLITVESTDPEELLWRWFKKYLPRCFNEIPRQRRSTFMKGVMRAVEDEEL